LSRLRADFPLVILDYPYQLDYGGSLRIWPLIYRILSYSSRHLTLFINVQPLATKNKLDSEYRRNTILVSLSTEHIEVFL